VVTAGTVAVGDSVYVFEPGPRRRLEVEVVFDAPAIGTQRAEWNGTFETFVSDIAWARTFGFRRDATELSARGRARGANPDVVMILDDDGLVEPPGASARPSEFARHKLLDLVGDLYLFGGPPCGTVFAQRPGHAATHRAVAVAIGRGILERRGSVETPRPW
jgi:UDP-3-O-[3-hydroxymyristoyl] N-acetylglucosamine deacetylase